MGDTHTKVNKIQLDSSYKKEYFVNRKFSGRNDLHLENKTNDITSDEVKKSGNENNKNIHKILRLLKV